HDRRHWVRTVEARRTLCLQAQPRLRRVDVPGVREYAIIFPRHAADVRPTSLRPCSAASTASNGAAQQNRLAIASCSWSVPTPAACSAAHIARKVTNANVTT